MVPVPCCIIDGFPQDLTGFDALCPHQGALFTNSTIGEWSDDTSDLVSHDQSTEQWNAARIYTTVHRMRTRGVATHYCFYVLI